jgi:N-acetylglucosaminyl-diphospho-decaprenol L-rhamnosyltransferase
MALPGWLDPEPAHVPTFPAIVTLIVGYRNAEDVVVCLHALSTSVIQPEFEIFVAENGGFDGMGALTRALSRDASPCRPATGTLPIIAPSTLDTPTYRLVRPDGYDGARVHILQMPDNLGYAGAINTCLRPLLEIPGWTAAWILNPDTAPSPVALRELALESRRRNRGMISSRLVAMQGEHPSCSRGLKWHKFTARTTVVALEPRPGFAPDPGDIEAQLDAPSGASLYVTRSLINRIGLMDERYFLYFEDLEWGHRAKAIRELGHAHNSIVPHKGGTTIGSAPNRAARSSLSVYLEFRNRILFVRHTDSAWLAWTVAMQLVHVAAFIFTGSAGNLIFAARGVWAGLRGETGRPDGVFPPLRVP